MLKSYSLILKLKIAICNQNLFAYTHIMPMPFRLSLLDVPLKIALFDTLIEWNCGGVNTFTLCIHCLQSYIMCTRTLFKFSPLHTTVNIYN